MSIITCSECGRKISSQAPVCISCGAPVGIKLNQTVTTELTSKRFKKHILISSIVFWISLLCMFAAPAMESFIAGIFSSFVLVVSLGWLVATKIRIWWHHK